MQGKLDEPKENALKKLVSSASQRRELETFKDIEYEESNKGTIEARKTMRIEMSKEIGDK